MDSDQDGHSVDPALDSNCLQWLSAHDKSRRFFVLTLILTLSSSVSAKALLSVRDRNLILSRASEAFDINSLKNI